MNRRQITPRRRSRPLLGHWVVVLVLLMGCGKSGSQIVDDGLAPTTESRDSESQAATSVGNEVTLLPALKERRYDAAIRDIAVREDPVVDGWDSERFSELAAQQFKKLGHLFQTGDVSQVDDLCAQKFVGSDIRPLDLAEVYEGPLFSVQRAVQDSGSVNEYKGRTGFQTIVKRQAEVIPPDATSHFKFKIIRANVKGRAATTSAYFQMTAATKENQRIQVNSTWDCSWTVTEGAPRLSAILVKEYEEVKFAARSLPAFSDCTQAAFSGLTVLDEQLVFGRDHWYANLESTIGVEGRGNGIAIGDVNGDGLEDIYLCQPAALPNRLLQPGATWVMCL